MNVNVWKIMLFVTVVGAISLLTEQYLPAKLVIPMAQPTPAPVVPKFIPFGVGEKLEYSVNWGNIRAGSATLRLEAVIDYQGHQVYQAVVDAQSSGFFSVFFPVRDRLESLIDVKGIFSRRYWTQQSEGNWKGERKYEFDQENNSARYNDENYYIRYGVQDEMSAVFYVRTLDLRVGNPIYLDIFAKKQNWQVKCNVLTTEKIRVGAGEFDTILVEPELRFDGIMKKGKIKVWYTNDARRIPVQVKSRFVLGAITIELENYQLSKEISSNKQE